MHLLVIIWHEYSTASVPIPKLVQDYSETDFPGRNESFKSELSFQVLVNETFWREQKKGSQGKEEEKEKCHLFPWRHKAKS